MGVRVLARGTVTWKPKMSHPTIRSAACRVVAPALTCLTALAPCAMAAPGQAAPPAVTYEQLHSFTVADGQCPVGGLLFSKDGSVYGVASGGGAHGMGTVFAVDPSGAFRVLHSFGRGANEGKKPKSGLVEVAGVLYGVTTVGGANGDGVAYKLSKTGKFTLLHSFTREVDGLWPQGPLVHASDGNFYGSTFYGGAYGLGTVFRMDKAGNLTTLWDMDPYGKGEAGEPGGGFIQATDGLLYGTSQAGGTGSGTVFSVGLDGTHATVHAFNGYDGFVATNGVIQGRDGALYGTTSSDGWDATGVAFRVTTGGDFTKLHDFSNAPGEGWAPYGRLVESAADVFLGTTYIGGTTNGGTVFRLRADGSFAYLHMFGSAIDAGVDGRGPEGGLVRTGKGEYVGTTCYGGADDAGTVYRIRTQ